MKIDSNNMYGAIMDFPKNIEKALEIVGKLTFKNKYNKIDNVVISGMGGSAIGADVVSVLGKENIDIPLFISRGYTLPKWVNEKSLVICSSYSGNTEETLYSFDDAVKKNAQICGITTGGLLADKLKILEKDIIIIPSGLQPRAALAFSFIPISKILEKLGILKLGFNGWLYDFLKNINKYQQLYCMENNQNPIYRLAKNIFKKIPIIYSNNSTLSVIGVRIKGQLAENSKMLSYQNDLPEFNHNEIVGWENNMDILNKFTIIWLKDFQDNKRIRLRQVITKEIFDEIGISQNFIEVEGKTFEERFLHMVHYGDWLSYWCAILHQTNPTPVIKIDRLKKNLEDLS